MYSRTFWVAAGRAHFENVCLASTKPVLLLKSSVLSLLEQVCHARDLVRDTHERATQEQKAPPEAGLIVGDPLVEACHAPDLVPDTLAQAV